MSNSIELPKLPFATERPAPQTERESLPFLSVPLTQDAQAGRAAAAQASDFESYLNRRAIFRLDRHKSAKFDPAAEVLRRSVYKPFKSKPGR